MATHIFEFFGFPVTDKSESAVHARQALYCPFAEGTCTKRLRDGTISGVCTLKPTSGSPVICCPTRLYADKYAILRDVADEVFGIGLPFEVGGAASRVARASGSPVVAVFGKGWGGELRLPKRGGRGGYFVDWILALIQPNGLMSEFVAIEVQSIDTTGNYRAERDALFDGLPPSTSTAGFNWENVNKRILPQLIYKGHVLRREPLCKKGLFFICPTPVYRRIHDRLGGELMEYGLQPGSLTFRWYDHAMSPSAGMPLALECTGQFTTTIDQVAVAFTAPKNLPPGRVYETAIRAVLTGG